MPLVFNTTTLNQLKLPVNPFFTFFALLAFVLQAGAHELPQVIDFQTNESSVYEVAGKNNNTPPVAAITNLSVTTQKLGQSFSYIYPQITNGIINVLGNAYDVDAGDVVSYQLLLQKPDGTLVANITPGADPVSGYRTGTDQAGVLASNVDLSIYQNGVYDVVLNVFDGWAVSSDSARILLNTQLKIGQFSFSVQDVALPVSGIPLTVTRTYNSFNLNNGEFGYSWTYAMNDINLQLDEVRQDTPDIDGNTFNLRVGGGRDVTLTLPDGRTETFQFYFDLSHPGAGGFCYAAWKSAPGVSYTLTAIGNPYYASLTGFWNNESGTGFDSYDFPGYILTAHDGTQYVIQRDDMGEYFFASGDNGGYSDNDAYVHTYGDSHLVKIIQPNGSVIQINSDKIDHYNPAGSLTRSVRFERDGQGRITAVRDPNSGSNGLPSVKYFYDANGNLVNVSHLTSSAGAGSYDTTTYQYTNSHFPHFLTGIVDPRGVSVARSEYDDKGRLSVSYDAFGNRITNLHDTTNHVETIIDQLGYGSTNYYDLRGNITATVNALGQTNQFAYDENNNLRQTIDPLGNTNSYGYDVNGLRTATTNALGAVISYNFDALGNLKVKTDALTNTTSFDYDPAGHRIRVVDAMGHGTAFGHDIFGRPTAVTNALQQLRAVAGSDSQGELKFVSQAGGLEMDFAHDLNGNTTNTSFVWVDPNDASQSRVLSTITEIDAANRVTRVTDPDGQSRMTLYDSSGRVAQSIDRMGSVNSYFYDAGGNLVQTTYADGSVSRSVYDAKNQVVYSDDRHLPGLPANGSHNIYDPLGRSIRSERRANVQIDITFNSGIPQSVLTSAGTVVSASSTAYDIAGRVLASTNALGSITRYEYDAVGRQTAVIDPLTNRTDSVYDIGGQLRFTTNAIGGVTEYQYDAKGRRIKTIFPDQSYTTNCYNEIGQLMFVRDQAGLETDYQYDSLGRISAVIKPQVFDPEGGTNVNPLYQYDHDAYGILTAIRDPKQRQTRFTFDALGEPVSRILPLSQTNFNAYNALGQLDYSVDFKGQSNHFVYDSLGRVTTNLLYAAGATSPAQTNIFAYDANGRLSQTLRPEGATTMQYNQDGAVTQITSPEGWISYEYDSTMGWLTRCYTVNSDVRYGYDGVSRLKTVTVMKRNGVALVVPEVTTNTYTKLGSLQNVYYPNGTWTAYQYDVMNHLTNMVHYNSASQVLASYQYTVASDGTRQASAGVNFFL